MAPALSERIEWLVSEGQEYFCCRVAGLEEVQLNKSRALKDSYHETIWQRETQFEHVWDVQRGELSGLSGNQTGLVHTHISFATRNCRRLF